MAQTTQTEQAKQSQPGPHVHGAGRAKGEDTTRRDDAAQQDRGEEAESTLRRWPRATTAAAAGLGLLAAAWLGVGEVAIAGAAGYLAYRWLRRERTGAVPAQT